MKTSWDTFSKEIPPDAEIFRRKMIAMIKKRQKSVRSLEKAAADNKNYAGAAAWKQMRSTLNSILDEMGVDEKDLDLL
jgi:hypothetical protein